MHILIVSEDNWLLYDDAFRELEARGHVVRRLTLAEHRPRAKRLRKIARYLPGKALLDLLRREIGAFQPDIIQVTASRATALAVRLALRGNPRPAMLFERGAIGGLGLTNPIDWLTHFSARVDAVVIPSYAMLNNWVGRPLLRRVLPPARCEVLHHPVPMPANPSAEDRVALRERLGLPADAFIVGTVCNVRPIKNLVFLARAVRAVGDGCLLAVVGRPGDDTLQAALSEAGGDSLRELGPIPDAAGIMPVFDLYATPTRMPGESFGMAPAEAMAAGLAVLTMAFGGTADLIEDGFSGLALPPRAQAWTAAIRELMRDPERLAAMGAEARRRMRTRFSVEAVADQLERIYARRIAQRAGDVGG
ncbi:glycosyltransferase family 4 protein [Nitratireductor mangrovi]|uniref:Glycosyltransferase family 4 protein n=1 Tax=Nitratireductor mangrovi TaxID=2599600 RepID=A0A5B8L232_9HYPH|nr:glycosyltransferase family 4 protein [Nitratireductor mangrovi]QDZ01732.1 glycosyltransferase family 4 protein [Nitratireductor mangrovi]